LLSREEGVVLGFNWLLMGSFLIPVTSRANIDMTSRTIAGTGKEFITNDIQELKVRCLILVERLHSRMPLTSTRACLKRVQR
jgi:hypothetical protein